MQTPSSPAERIAFWKDVKRQLIQQHDDIDRLWRLTDEMSLGVPFGGNGTITATTTTSTSSTTTDSGSCSDCHDQYTFTISGIVNRSGSTCDTAMNGTWTVTKETGVCVWKSGSVGGCCAGSLDVWKLQFNRTSEVFELYYCSNSYPIWKSSGGSACDGSGGIMMTVHDDNGFTVVSDFLMYPV